MLFDGSKVVTGEKPESFWKVNKTIKLPSPYLLSTCILTLSEKSITS